MSMRIEVDAVDAELLACLKKAKASRCMSWDSTLKPGVTVKIEITYPLNDVVPPMAIQAINKCMTECDSAFRNEGSPDSASEGSKP